MPMDRQLRRKIIRFITPFFQDMHNRQSIVDNAFWGEDFQNQVDTSGTPKGFAEHLLKQVDTYHGISGIKQLLKTFHDDITPGRKDEIEALLEELDPPVEKVLLRDQRPINVDTFARYSIVDPLEFYKNLKS
ncbi:MAG: hypothetical protein ACPG7F_14290, partial [Aggregatilineales bacterium]